MRQATLSISEVGLIAATRAIAGAGAGLLLAGRVPEKQRKMIGWGLFAIGALSTIPLILDVARKSVNPNSPRHKGETLPSPKTTRMGRGPRNGSRNGMRASVI